jgi:hypothetical protein
MSKKHYHYFFGLTQFLLLTTWLPQTTMAMDDLLEDTMNMTDHPEIILEPSFSVTPKIRNFIFDDQSLILATDKPYLESLSAVIGTYGRQLDQWDFIAPLERPLDQTPNLDVEPGSPWLSYSTGQLALLNDTLILPYANGFYPFKKIQNHWTPQTNSIIAFSEATSPIEPFLHPDYMVANFKTVTAEDNYLSHVTVFRRSDNDWIPDWSWTFTNQSTEGRIHGKNLVMVTNATLIPDKQPSIQIYRLENGQWNLKDTVTTPHSSHWSANDHWVVIALSTEDPFVPGTLLEAYQIQPNGTIIHRQTLDTQGLDLGNDSNSIESRINNHYLALYRSGIDHVTIQLNVLQNNQWIPHSTLQATSGSQSFHSTHASSLQLTDKRLGYARHYLDETEGVSETLIYRLCHPQRGDVNCDMTHDVADVVCSLQTILSPENPPACQWGETSRADLNCDGTYSVVDAQIAIIMAHSLKCDAASGICQSGLSPNLDANQNAIVDACEGI